MEIGFEVGLCLALRVVLVLIISVGTGGAGVLAPTLSSRGERLVLRCFSFQLVSCLDLRSSVDPGQLNGCGSQLRIDHSTQQSRQSHGKTASVTF